MITDATIVAVAAATDHSVVVEFYAADQAPGATGFDPGDALKRFSAIAGLEFAGETYTQLVRSIGRMRRTTAETSNSLQVTLDNLTREASQFEFATGFEGLIVVVRLISRSLSTSLSRSIILFTGRCDKPTSGTRDALSVTAKQILHSVDLIVPRRKYSPIDSEGRTPDNKDFDGFPYMPQQNAGTTTYSARERRGGLLGFLGFKKTVTKTLQYSSFSDLDAERYVPIILGRAQVAGTHLAYADVGTRVRMTTAFAEGAIESFDTYRTDDARFIISGTVHKRFGYPADLGPTPYEQIPVPNAQWIGNGYYARTAMFFCEAGGTSIDQVDPAPNIIIIALGLRVTVPIAGVWTTVDSWDAAAKWSDNAAAHVRWLLTSPDFYRLDDNWIDDDSFSAAYDYNDEILFDTSFSDIIFTPDTVNFAGGATEQNRFILSTGVCSAEYFKYLNGDATAAETFLQTAFAQPYSSAIPSSFASPGDPVDIPDLPGGTGDLSFYLRRRYTCNTVITEPIAGTDLLHQVLMLSSRMFLSQDPQTGKLKLRHKRPADYAMATAAISTTTAAVDDASPWISDQRGFALLDSNTSNSELREVTGANYPATTHNAVTLTAPAETVVGFSGCDDASTPASATVQFTTVTAFVAKTITLAGTAIVFRPGNNDTVETCAGFLYGAINAHPTLRRRFIASWTPGSDTVTITARFGNLTLAGAPGMTHAAPLADPTAAPTLTAPTATGTLKLGTYFVGYTYVNARGQTLMSPLDSIAISGSNRRITVAAITPPGGATSINWFCSPTANSLKLRYYKNNDGSSHTIDLADLPLLTAAIRPDMNRTGCEVLRVEAAFTDRAETRAAATRSNVIRASYKWKLGNLSKPINRIDFKFRDASQDFRLVELRLRDDVHIAKIKKTNNAEFNGQAVDNWNQAYRIASGLLAELRDADFFYEWESDKAALLLEEGDIVAITDDGAEVYNLPVRIESIEYGERGGMVTCNFTARLYTSTLYDDSVAERNIPIVIEASNAVDFV